MIKNGFTCLPPRKRFDLARLNTFPSLLEQPSLPYEILNREKCVDFPFSFIFFCFLVCVVSDILLLYIKANKSFEMGFLCQALYTMSRRILTRIMQSEFPLTADAMHKAFWHYDKAAELFVVVFCFPMIRVNATVPDIGILVHGHQHRSPS